MKTTLYGGGVIEVGARAFGVVGDAAIARKLVEKAALLVASFAAPACLVTIHTTQQG